MLTKIDLEQIEEIVNRCIDKKIEPILLDIKELKADVAQLKTDAAQLKVDMLIVKTRTATIDESVKVIRYELVNVNTFAINVANHVEAELESFRWEINDKPKED